MAELPDGTLLVTEREGRLRRITSSGLVAEPVSGLPEDVLIDGQGGLLGLALAPDFAVSRALFLSYSRQDGDTNTTAVVRGILTPDATALTDVTHIFDGAPRETTYHYGGRLAFLDDGSLIVTLGDGYRYMDEAQNPSNRHGAIARIWPDGSIPEDNPFISGGGDPAVYSYGHRNVQGLVFDEARNLLWAHEHGPKGGDELNLLEAGANYGWPAITYGINYDGTVITDQTKAPGLKQPVWKWVPSIAPSGMALVQTESFPAWRGDLLIGAMNGPKGQKIVRIDLDPDGEVVGSEDILTDLGLGFRDVLSTRTALYAATNDLDATLYRIEPVR
jgi:glucose/arabinose dehydrogenase